MAINIDAAAKRIGERLRDKVTEQHRIPFDTGDLRKSIYTHSIGVGRAAVGSHLPYARAVHDGRGEVTIEPNIKRNPPLGRRTLVKKIRYGKGKKKVKRVRMSKAKYEKHARLKFTVGGKTFYAKLRAKTGKVG